MTIGANEINWGLNDDDGRHQPAATVETPAAIDADIMLRMIVDTIQSFVVMSAEQAIAIALWIVHTFVFEAAEATPYICANSAAKRSGKTRLLELLSLLVNRPWMTGKVTAAVLIRKTDKEHPTLLLDESDATFNQDTDYAEALRGLLNSGYRASGKASLCIGQGANITYKDFSTFCPKVIAGIGKLPDTVMDRSIIITLKRRAKSEPVCRFRERHVREQMDPIRRQLESWAQANLSALRGREPQLPEALSDRAQDVWEPLLAIADQVGGDWPTLARKTAVMLSRDTMNEDDITVQLLADCRDIFEANDNPEVMTSKALVEHLIAVEDHPWAAWSQGKPITQAKVARMLGGYDIHPTKLRIGEKTPNGYTRLMFLDAWSRYPPLKVEHRNKPNNDGPETLKTEVEHDQACSTSKTPVSPDKHCSRSTVPLSEPHMSAEPQKAGKDQSDDYLF